MEMQYDEKQIKSLQERLLNGVREKLDGVVVNGSEERRYAGNLNLSFAYVEGESLLMGLKEVAVSSGSACTSANLEPSYVLWALGVDEDMAHTSIRFGIGRFTTEAEIDRAVVFPSRAVAIENALRLFSPRLAVVDEHLTLHLPRQWLTSLVIENIGSDNPSQDILTVIEALRESDLMIEVIKKLKPQLSSLPGSSGVLKYLAGTTSTLTCSNYLWPSKKSGLFRSGSSFHHFRRRGHLQGIVQDCRTTRGDHCLSVLNNSLSINEAEYTALIHMDVDQSILPIPSAVKAAIFESFARQNMAYSEIDVTSSIKHFIKRNFGFPTDSSTEFVIADSSLALFNKVVLCCIQA
ncbi:hypothetical protein CMV_030761, partial [Castanea mollissima]